MDFSIPEETASFVGVVGDWARDSLECDKAAWNHTKSLAELGVFGLLGEDAVDSDNQYLNLSLVLARLARAGMVGPLAETIWANAFTSATVLDEGWVGAPLPLIRDGAALVPFGRRIAWLIEDDAAGQARPVAAGELPEAYVPLCDEAAWGPEAGTSTLEQLDDAYAWLAYASLTLGYSRRLIDLALRQADGRKAFRRPILTFQAPRFALTECYQLVEGMELSVRDAAWRRDRDQSTFRAFAAAAWLLAADVGRRVAVNVHQVMGAASFPREVGVTDATGAMALLRVGNGVDVAAGALWQKWRDAAVDRPSNVSGALAGPTGQLASDSTPSSVERRSA